MAWSHGLVVRLSGLDIGVRPGKFRNGLASTNQGSLAQFGQYSFHIRSIFIPNKCHFSLSTWK